jgi:hypothetical protein
MKPIEKMTQQAIELGMKKYNELMQDANGKYEEAMEVYKKVQLVKEVLPKALEEYENLSDFEKLLLDTMITELVSEVEKTLGGIK